jgi:hypothetical protein
VGIALMAVAANLKRGDGDDFRQFYRAATLAQTHQSVFAHPSFSPDKNADGGYLPYNRIPSYAAALRPLASLPYPAARRVWIGLTVLAFLGCIWLSPLRRDHLAIALAFSFPVAFTFALGQDIGFVVLIVLATARIYSSEREFLAGLVASLLAIKLTYLPATGLVFLAKSRRGTAGFALGIAIQLVVCFAVGGIGWPVDYLASLQRSALVFDVRLMPNIRAVTAFLALPEGVWLIGAIAIFIWLFRASKRLCFTDALLIALPLGLIASPYCFVYDAVVLVPLLASVVSLDSWDGLLTGVALTPVPWLLLMTDGSIPLLAGSLLTVASTLAAAARLLRLRDSAAPSGASIRTAISPSFEAAG